MASRPELQARLGRLVTGHVVTACTYAVAALGVVDAIPPDGSAEVDELAARVGADADALYRVLRLLAAEEVFAEVAPRTFAVTELGELLRDGDPSPRDFALLHGTQVMPMFVHMLETVRTGTPVPILRTGKSRWELLAEDPAQSELFNRAMRAGAVRRLEPLWSIDWSTAHTVVDVGGGTGGVLLPLLEREPHLRGVLFDLEHVVADAQVGERCTIESGSFFDSVPRGGDVYLLSAILHDWGDADAGRILAACRAAMEPGTRLVALESVVTPGNERDPVKLLDVQMLVALGGRERTEPEFRALLGAHGFELVRVVGKGACALEARAV